MLGSDLRQESRSPHLGLWPPSSPNGFQRFFPPYSLIRFANYSIQLVEQRKRQGQRGSVTCQKSHSQVWNGKGLSWGQFWEELEGRSASQCPFGTPGWSLHLSWEGGRREVTLKGPQIQLCPLTLVKGSCVPSLMDSLIPTHHPLGFLCTKGGSQGCGGPRKARVGTPGQRVEPHPLLDWSPASYS